MTKKEKIIVFSCTIVMVICFVSLFAYSFANTSEKNISITELKTNSIKININDATSEQLEYLDGIGAVTAKTIMDYRAQNGPFTKIEDIMLVKGIKQATFNKIKDSITVE